MYTETGRNEQLNINIEDRYIVPSVDMMVTIYLNPAYLANLLKGMDMSSI